MQRFQGEIFNTPELTPGFFIILRHGITEKPDKENIHRKKYSNFTFTKIFQVLWVHFRRKAPETGPSGVPLRQPRCHAPFFALPVRNAQSLWA
jgi:hypothetical protein